MTPTGPHCHAFFEGVGRFAAHDDEIAAFCLTDFLVRQFDAFAGPPMGLDRYPDLRDMIPGTYTGLVCQAQTDDAALRARAEDCARRLGLMYEYRSTGYGDLKTALADQAARGRGGRSRLGACVSNARNRPVAPLPAPQCSCATPSIVPKSGYCSSTASGASSGQSTSSTNGSCVSHSATFTSSVTILL